MRLNNSTYLGVLGSYNLDAHITIGQDTILTLLYTKFCLSMPSEEHAALAC